MDPFVLSRNAFNIYCSEYANTNSSATVTNNNNNQPKIDTNHSSICQPEKVNQNNFYYEKAIHQLNHRYEYFLQTLDRLQISFGQIANTISHKNHNINSLSNRERKTSISSFVTNKRNNKKHLYQSVKRRMPKVYITVSCAEHFTQQQPNV
ncbi:unnamed protein product [Rotaria sp. Silwood1]|nr:unnamed protein product [Rotaria sp. Silwood1]CAF1259234.1 unnamed protein product [Rotaria sp. Silwood1]CAF1263959.1 unnamed protein product [Rotaria sp. Silwood1]CAF3457040.1 unnamed protein product [Rotaria sp. Silwood1]CAF3497708.1 unnamed protein product [Rotaria sp. Silwood1]